MEEGGSPYCLPVLVTGEILAAPNRTRDKWSRTKVSPRTIFCPAALRSESVSLIFALHPSMPPSLLSEEQQQQTQDGGARTRGPCGKAGSGGGGEEAGSVTVSPRGIVGRRFEQAGRQPRRINTPATGETNTAVTDIARDGRATFAHPSSHQTRQSATTEGREDVGFLRERVDRAPRSTGQISPLL